MIYLIPVRFQCAVHSKTLVLHIELMDIGASQLCMNTLTQAHFTLWETLFGNGVLISDEPSL